MPLEKPVVHCDLVSSGFTTGVLMGRTKFAKFLTFHQGAETTFEKFTVVYRGFGMAGNTDVLKQA